MGGPFNAEAAAAAAMVAANGAEDGNIGNNNNNIAPAEVEADDAQVMAGGGLVHDHQD